MATAHAKGRSRSDRRRATLVRAGLIPAGRPHRPVVRHRRRHRAPGQEPGGGASVPARSGAAGGARPGQAAARATWCSSRSPMGFKAQIVRPLGKSNVLKDVMEALLADSWHPAGLQPKRAGRGGQGAPTRTTSHDSDRVDLRDLFTFTVDPVMAQDFDDALSFERTARRRHHGLRAYRRRLLLRARGDGARPGGAAPRQLGLRGHRGGAHAAAAALLRGLLAAARTRTARRSRWRWRWTTSGKVLQQPLLPLAHPQRPPPGLRAAGADVPRASSRWTPSWREPLDWGQDAGADAARDPAASAAACRSSPPSPSSSGTRTAR